MLKILVIGMKPERVPAKRGDVVQTMEVDADLVVGPTCHYATPETLAYLERRITELRRQKRKEATNDPK